MLVGMELFNLRQGFEDARPFRRSLAATPGVHSTSALWL